MECVNWRKKLAESRTKLAGLDWTTTPALETFGAKNSLREKPGAEYVDQL